MHERYMRRALELADQAADEEETPVGAGALVAARIRTLEHAIR